MFGGEYPTACGENISPRLPWRTPLCAHADGGRPWRRMKAEQSDL